MTDAQPEYDYVIVGGGSAGCVLANRLSADPSINVLLIEAGPDFSPGQEPPALRDRGVRAFMLRQYFWPDVHVSDGERPVPVLLARLVGGGSAINGMHAQRGAPDDYDEWRQLGVEGWSWNDLLPYFCRVEDDYDFGGPAHGKQGPIKIRRVPEDLWSPLSHAVRRVLDAQGLPRREDINTEPGDGTGPVPLSNSETERVSAAAGYLTPAVRARPNLAILANSPVRRVIFEERRVSAVELEDGRRFATPQVFISAGALQSPAVLLRSGVGPHEDLRRAGIPVVCDRAGVGKRLGAHPMFTITAHLKRPGRQLRREVRQPAPMVIRYSSGGPDCHASDLMINLWERTPGPLEIDPLGRQLALLMVLLNKSYSLGSVVLDPQNPFGTPKVNAALLSDERDLRRMVQAFRFMSAILAAPEVASIVNETFVSNIAQGQPPDAMTVKLLQDNLTAKLISRAAAFAFDYVPGARAKALRSAGRSVNSILAMPDAELEQFIKVITNFGSHPVGTCSMGEPTAAATVLDSRCRVVGVDGLRVADTSIFPTPMRAGTNLPVIMAAEKAAEMALQDRRAIAVSGGNDGLAVVKSSGRDEHVVAQR